MTCGRRIILNRTVSLCAVMVWLGAVGFPSPAQSETCVLSSQHAGETFPVERIDPAWACRLQTIIDHHTTLNKVGPIRAALPESMYLYLLDRPPLAAALLNRLDLGPYKSDVRGPGTFWGDDGEGTKGIVQLVYKDQSSRIYYLEGTHHSRVLPNITGKAVVFLRMHPVRDADNIEAMDSTMVSYTRLDNRILSGLVSLLHPLIGGTVSRKLGKGVETVHRLGLMMRQQPDRVLLKAMDQPALPDEDLRYLQQALRAVQSSDYPPQKPARP
jgi:hypothetical protein